MQSHSCASFVGEESDSALDPASTREDFSGSAFWPERKDVAEIAPAAATSAVVTGKQFSNISELASIMTWRSLWISF